MDVNMLEVVNVAFLTLVFLTLIRLARWATTRPD